MAQQVTSFARRMLKQSPTDQNWPWRMPDDRLADCAAKKQSTELFNQGIARIGKLAKGPKSWKAPRASRPSRESA
jgi:hypothetical protein